MAVLQDPVFEKYSRALPSVDAVFVHDSKEDQAPVEAVVDEFVRLDLRFDSGRMENMVLEDGDTKAKATGTGYVLGREPLTQGKAIWQFTSIQDSSNDETTCVTVEPGLLPLSPLGSREVLFPATTCRCWGAAVLPLTGSKYDCSSFYTLRSYNGKIYRVCTAPPVLVIVRSCKSPLLCLYAQAGSEIPGEFTKVHAGNKVQVHCDFETRSLRWFVNGQPCGPEVKVDGDGPIYPCFTTYGSSPVATIQSADDIDVEDASAGAADAAGDNSAANAMFEVTNDSSAAQQGDSSPEAVLAAMTVPFSQGVLSGVAARALSFAYSVTKVCFVSVLCNK